LPEVSVIIPNYNHSTFLKKRIDSVLNQTFQNFELIILDDCSSDNSPSVIETYRGHPKISHIVYNKRNSGSPFKQWEMGLQLAKGNKIWFAESDDWAEPAFLETVLKRMNEDQNIGISFTNSNWVDDHDKIGKDLSLYKESFCISGKEEIKRALLKFNSIQNASSALIRKDLAVKYISGLDKYKSCGDLIFYLRILQDSNLCYSSEKLNNFRWYHRNVSNNAKEKGLWLYEGIDVLRNVNLKKIKLKVTELRSIIHHWKSMYRSDLSKNNSSLAFKVYFHWIINTFIMRYLIRWLL
jgi:glycosyltransferase involved in cell wall biosynthesis